MITSKILFNFFIGLLCFLSNPSLERDVEETGTLVVEVENIKDVQGELLLGVYKDRKSFRKIKKVYRHAIEKVNSQEALLVVDDLPYGEYAVVIFQDYNGNRKFDYNFLGLPKEPFGFGNNYIVKRRAPKFKEVLIIHNSDDTELKIQLQEF